MVDTIENEVAGDHPRVVWHPGALSVEEMAVEHVLEERPHEHSHGEGYDCLEARCLSLAQEIVDSWDAGDGSLLPRSHGDQFKNRIFEEPHRSPGVDQHLWCIEVVIVLLKIPFGIHHLPPKAFGWIEGKGLNQLRTKSILLNGLGSLHSPNLRQLSNDLES